MKRRSRPALLVFLVALAFACVWVAVHHPHTVAAATVAQPAMPHMAHSQTTPGVIDGSIHPELIPDSAAYRLFFLAASRGGLSPTPQETVHERAMLFGAGVHGRLEASAARTVLANFRAQYVALVSNYNTSWYVTHNSTAGLARFLADRDALVQSTRDQLKAALPATDMAALDKKVQAEKVHMRVAEAEALR